MNVDIGDGRSLFVRVSGSGTPLLLLHGFAGSGDGWGPRITDALADRHRVLAVDLPGHGRSARADDVAAAGIAEVVEALVRLLDRLEMSTTTWAGYSMGGRVALAGAALRPERVARLIVESGSPGLRSERERRERRAADEELARMVETEGIAAFVALWESLPLFATQSRLPGSEAEAVRRRRMAQRPEGLAASLRGCGTGSQPSLWEALGRVAAPTLLIAGEEDSKFLAIAERMAAALPDARLRVVAKSGHAVHLEQPAGWLEAVEAFLDGDGAPS